jgi:hypothetical protein
MYSIERIFSEKYSTFFDKYNGIKERVGPTLERNNEKYFSEHGLKHCDDILENIDSLLPHEIQDNMGKNEFFCLFCSILLHDIGRINEKHPYELFKETNEDHARRSRDWIMKNGDRIGLYEPYKEVIALICHGHGDVEKVEKEIKSKSPDGYSIMNEEIDIFFLISLLRLGDVLDIGFWRVPREAIISLWETPTSEKDFILKDYLTNAVIINPKRWKIAIDVRKPRNIDEVFPGSFSKIKENLIEKKCNDVLKSTKYYLESKEIFFGSVDVRIKESGHDAVLEALSKKGETVGTYQRIYQQMAEEYKKYKDNIIDKNRKDKDNIIENRNAVFEEGEKGEIVKMYINKNGNGKKDVKSDQDAVFAGPGEIKRHINKNKIPRRGAI